MKRGRERSSYTVAATAKPSMRDIAWAAGFIEGEGSFVLNRPRATGACVAKVQAPQLNPEPLLRLQKFFGGSVRETGDRRRKQLGKPPCWLWRIGGARARGFTMTVYQFLSEKRQQQARRLLGGVA